MPTWKCPRRQSNCGPPLWSPRASPTARGRKRAETPQKILCNLRIFDGTWDNNFGKRGCDHGLRAQCPRLRRRLGRRRVCSASTARRVVTPSTGSKDSSGSGRPQQRTLRSWTCSPAMSSPRSLEVAATRPPRTWSSSHRLRTYSLCAPLLMGPAIRHPTCASLPRFSALRRA